MALHNDELATLTIPAGTLIHLGPCPFRLQEDVKVIGLKENYTDGMAWLKANDPEFRSSTVVDKIPEHTL